MRGGGWISLTLTLQSNKYTWLSPTHITTRLSHVFRLQTYQAAAKTLHAHNNCEKDTLNIAKFLMLPTVTYSG